MTRLVADLARAFLAGDFFVSLPFWASFSAIVLLYRSVSSTARRKEWLLLSCSVSMLLTLPGFGFSRLAVVFGVCVTTYGCAKILLLPAWDSCLRQRRVLAASGLLLNVLVLAFFKYAYVQKAVLRSIAMAGADTLVLIGVSYSSFRAMHFLIEAYRKEIRNADLLTFLNYMLFFPAFISGPIHRYNHYCTNTAAARHAPFRCDLAAGLPRIIRGLFKKIVLAAILFPFTVKNSGVPVEEMTGVQIMLGLYAFALYLYCDFSGYTDLAIGSARIMGFVLPENFNRPFLKQNIRQLWANFHMSLTGWLTDYIYWPIVRQLRNADFFKAHPVLLSNIAIVITFLICGMWHGSTSMFLLWGLYNGVGLSTVNVYQQWKRKVSNRTLRNYFNSSLSYSVGVVLTFNFYSAGLVLFVLQSRDVKLLVARWI
jgi:alginate O-acetyltransferase complex protein AlgI